MVDIETEFLSKVSMFEGLPGDMLESLGDYLDQLELAPGETLFKQGQAGQSLYIIRNGCIDIMLEGNRERSVKITSLKSGECFGELSALDGQPRSATAVAAERTTLLEFHKDRFMEFMNENPVIAKNLLLMLGGLIRTTNNWLVTFEGQANVDKLTGLFNRRWFDKILVQEFNRSQRNGSPLSLLMADIDHFKLLNDRYGHVNGDQVLKQLSKVMHRGVRSIDLLARVGGEEFAVILPETPLNRAVDVAERIRRLVENHDYLDLNGAKMTDVTISIGVAEKDRLVNPTDLLERGDSALYLAKSCGRNCVRSKP